MARMRASWFVFARVPAAWLTRASFRSSTVALAAVLVSTSPARAQVADPTGVVQLGPHLDWAGIESTAPHDLRWDERLPESRPEPTAGDIRGDLPRSRMADLADIEGIFSYRFVGEHFSSLAGNSISFSDDTDCDGFSEVLIGSPLFGGQRSGGPGAAYVVSVADMEAADAADGIVDRVVDLGFVAALPRSWKLVGAGQQGVGTAVASNGDANGDGCSDLLIGAPDRYSTGSAYVVSALDLPAADAADGEADGVVDIRRIADQPDSWEITDGDRGDSAGTQVAFVRDMNGDGRSDLLIGAPAFYVQNQPGAAYVLSGAALPSADAEDGVADGRIALASVAAQPDSWKLVGENAGDRVGGQLSAANLDSDARSDFIVDASSHTAGLDRQGAVYLIAASDLPAMDSADGDLDGLIELRNAAGGNASWKLLGSARNQVIGSTHLGARAVATGDVVGDGRDEVVIATQAWTDAPDAGVFVVSVPDLPSADEADGAEDGVVRLDYALAQDDSFTLEWDGPRFNVSSNVDVDGNGRVDILVGSYDYRDVGCLPGGGYGSHGGVALVPGGSLHAADAADGEADTVVDLEGMSSADGFWKFIGGPTDRLGTAVSAGDMDGDGKDDPILASMIHHIPYRACGSRVSTGFVFVMSSAHFQAADALDGETDGEIRVDTLHVDVEPEPPVVREITQFEDSIVVMRVSGSLKTAELDFDTLADGFYEHYEDEFDYLVFISNLPTLNYSQRHLYYGIHMDVSNTVRGTGRRIYDSGGTLKAMIHFPYRDPILYGPSLHEIMHSWANYAIPTVEPVHWGFSSANGQLGGFDLANLVDLGNGRYSAGRFGTFANGGNSLPYSPMELYFAGLISPKEVPDLLVAKDGEWAGERDESGNSIFTASDVETWSVRRVVEEKGVRAPDWRSSQKSFRAAVVLITDDGFPATSATLRELREALRTFSHPGSDGNDGSFNFWEATGGRAAIKMDDLQGSGVPVVTNQPPAPAGVLAPLTIAVDGAAVTVDVSAAFRDPDGDRLTYGATSSAPGIASAVALGTAVIVTPVAEGTSTVTVTATDTGGSNGTATQTFTVTVGPGANRPPVPVGRLAAVTLGVDEAAVTVEVAAAFRDPDGDTLTYGASSSAPGVVSAVAFGTAVIVTPVAEGTATVMVTATDPRGLSATQALTVTVSPPANRPPEPVGALVPLTIGVDEAAVTLEVLGAFRDPDGDALTYGATSSSPGVASVSVSGSTVTVTPVSEGTSTVTVTATDTGGSNTPATQAFTVTVPRPFTDHPIVPGVTPVKAVHFTELRARIDVLRREARLAPISWTDRVLTAGVTPVRLAHLLELREALGEAYAAAGRSAPRWTDASPAGGATPIRAAHLMELRAAVTALE